MSKMLISVIVATCNRSDLLSKCLDLLIPENQMGCNNYEIIVTDDSKNDFTKKLIEEKYYNIKYVKGPQMGPASNRNNGAKHAKGGWLVFLDDDCLPDNDLLNNYSELIKGGSDIDVVEGLIYSDENIPLLFTAPVNLTGGHLWSCNFAIKTSVFQKINGFDEHYKYPNLEDNDLNRRLKMDGYKIVFGKHVKVYHPPRPVASPKKYAKYHESWLYYHNKFGEHKTVKDLLVTISLNRLRPILKEPKNFASIKAVFLLFEELFYTWNNSRKWDNNKTDF